VSEGLRIALIAASAAIFGGVLSALATRSVEKMRLRHAVQVETDARKLKAVLAFTNAAFAWFDWLMLMAEQGLSDDILEEYNRRSKARQEAYRELQLLCSDELFQWLRTVYDPLEYRVRDEIGTPVRWGKPVSPETVTLRREYLEMLYKTLIERFRPEIRALQKPVPADVGWLERRLGA
jgi:hypothetical protein